jgi:hypothetical protein
MGRKKLERPPIGDLFSTISQILVPAFILEDFDIYGARENSKEWTIELREKEERVPSELSGYEDVMFDGYCDPLHVLSHSFACKPVYLKIYRRRYKRSNQDKHFCNAYDLTLKGLRMVPEMGIFLKEEDRRLSG